MWIKYIIPEDGDDHTHPNIYELNATNAEVLVSEIVSSFPVPGKYHFRFLNSVGGLTVWLDSPNSNSPAPTFQGSIFVKASRLAASESTTSSAANFISEPEKPSQPTKPLLDEQIFDNSPPAPTSQPKGNAFGDADLLGLSSNSAPSIKTNSAASDPFGFDTLQPTNLTPTSSSANIPAMNPMGGSNPQRNTASPMPTMNAGSMRNMPPPQSGMGQGNFAPMGGGGMNPMGGGMGSMNPMTRGMGQPANNRDPFDTLGSGFGNNQQAQYNRGGAGGAKRY